MNDSTQGPTRPLDSKLRKQLETWRGEMVTLDRPQRVLYFNHTNTGTLHPSSPTAHATPPPPPAGTRRAQPAPADPARSPRPTQTFHTTLVESRPTPPIRDPGPRGWTRLPSLRSWTFRFVPGRAHESVDEHEALLKLIETGADADVIEKSARLHRSATLDAYLAQAQPLPQSNAGSLNAH